MVAAPAPWRLSGVKNAEKTAFAQAAWSLLLCLGMKTTPRFEIRGRPMDLTEETTMTKTTWSWLGLLGICALALPVAAQDVDLTEAIEGPPKANAGVDVDVNAPKVDTPKAVAPPAVQADDALPVPAAQGDAAVDVDVKADRAPRLDSQLEGDMKARANVDPALPGNPNPGVDVDATTDIDARNRAAMDRNRNNDRDRDRDHVDNNDRNAKWRYKQHNGEWWYWTPAGHWMYHRGGNWVTYDRANYSRPRGYQQQGNYYGGNVGGQAYYNDGYYNGPNRTYYRGGNNGYNNGYGRGYNNGYGNNGYGRGYNNGYGNGYGPGYYGGNRGAQQGANIGAGIGGAVGGQRGANLGAGIGAAIGSD